MTMPAKSHVSTPTAPSMGIESNALLDRCRAAREEVAAILSRHDGVHNLHGIHAQMRANERLAALNVWDDELERYMQANLSRARVIDRTGFDPRVRSNVQVQRRPALEPSTQTDDHGRSL